MIAAFGSPRYIKAWLNEFAMNGSRDYRNVLLVHGDCLVVAM